MYTSKYPITHISRCFIVAFYMATGFGPECGPSSGHYTRTRIYTLSLCSTKLDISPPPPLTLQIHSKCTCMQGVKGCLSNYKRPNDIFYSTL